MNKVIKLRSLRHGNVHLNADMIEAIYDHNGLTHVSTSKLIWEVKESIDDVARLIGSDPVQDGIKQHLEQRASIKRGYINLRFV